MRSPVTPLILILGVLMNNERTVSISFLLILYNVQSTEEFKQNKELRFKKKNPKRFNHLKIIP